MALGLEIHNGTAAGLIARLRPHMQDRLVIGDEANHLQWPQLEGCIS
ncbi:hypothetical protein [Pseudomonas fluorescens]|nr:hypothetical protein [Pseudomonas fluorescens]MBT2375408.1 hypothetical protein [Pseudomonas fluorescens]